MVLPPDTVAPPAASEPPAVALPTHEALISEAQREALAERLENELAADLAKPLRSCGSRLMLVCNGCGEFRSSEVRCRKRWCPVCAPMLARAKLARWDHAVSKLQWPLLVTLTMRNSPDPQCIRVLRKKWGMFRRRKLIRERVTGGVCAVEVTNTGNGWHPHLHALIDCRWLALHTREPSRRDSPEVVAELCKSAARELGATWAQQLGQETASVLATRVSGDAAKSYALKYATKAADLLGCPEPLAPMLRILRTSRLLSGFGSLHPLPALDEELPAAAFCEGCGGTKCWLPLEVLDKSIRRDLSHAATIGRSVPPHRQTP